MSLERRKYFDVVVVRATAMRNIFDMIARILLKNRNPVASKVMMILLLSFFFVFLFFLCYPQTAFLSSKGMLLKLPRYAVHSKKVKRIKSSHKEQNKNKSLYSSNAYLFGCPLLESLFYKSCSSIVF